jgi:hypothetical protein
VLSFDTPEQLAAEPDARRFWHLAILMALRDRAERVEVRFGEDGSGLLYHRVKGKDWEIAPVPDDVFPDLKPAMREAARLVAPERPEGQVTFGIPGARLEPQEIGWLTYTLSGHGFDFAVRIDPREPYGSITLDIEHPEEQEVAGMAAAALAEYYEASEATIDE